MKPQRKAILNKNQCDHSPFCPAKKACYIGAITQKKKWLFKAEIPEIDHDKCVGCGRCIQSCPRHAIRMK